MEPYCDELHKPADPLFKTTYIQYSFVQVVIVNINKSLLSATLLDSSEI